MRWNTDREFNHDAVEKIKLNDLMKTEMSSINDQPERSKREDSLIRELMKSSAVDISKLDNDPPYPLVWDKDFNFIGHKIIEEMRCSEHCGNTVREVQ